MNAGISRRKDSSAKVCHMIKDNPDAPLWIDLSKLPACVPLDYDGFRAILRRLIERHNELAKENGKPMISKRITTHLFRYYAQTRDEKQGMPRMIMCKLRGWKPDSKQPERYARLTIEDVDEYLKKQHGLVSDVENAEQIPKAVKCPRCKEINAPGMQYCFKCGLPLDEKTIINFVILQKSEA